MSGQNLIYQFVPDFRGVVVGPAFAALGYFAFRLRGKVSVAWLAALLTASAIVSLVGGLLGWREWGAVRKARSEGRGGVAEGPITHLADDPDGHRIESFAVDGLTFRFSWSNPQPGFDGPVKMYPVLREGSCIRVQYYADSALGPRITRIVTLEASHDACS